MEQRNLLLAFVLSLGVLLAWSAWMERHQPGSRQGAIPAAEPVREAPVPSAATEKKESAFAKKPPGPPTAPHWKAAEERHVVVETELFRAEFTTRGAGLLSWQLKNYVTNTGQSSGPLELSFRGESSKPALTTPLIELGLGDLSEAPFEIVESDARGVTFELPLEGVRVRKRYQFEPGSYSGRLELEIQNDTDRGLAPVMSLRWPAVARKGPDYTTTAFLAYQNGSLTRSPLQTFGRGGMLGSVTGREPQRVLSVEGDVEWAGVETNYFLAVLMPNGSRDAWARFEVVEVGREGIAALGHTAVTIPAGHAASRSFELYLGPKETKLLAQVHPSLEKSINLGWKWVAPLTRLFIWLLHACHTFIPNYGLAIIFLTVMVRLLTAPLMAKQMRSMKRMSAIQPRLRALQEKYADDRQRQSQEVMKLMREAGANPLGGCLPMLFQFPFLIGLFWALQSSIDLRQAPFVAWIQDLSAPETLFTIPGPDLPVRVLPLLMGGSMVLQQRMSPSTMDPNQARMMMTIMPIMLTVISYRFPSGLVLYWFVSNLLAIAHQLLINRQTSAEAPA